MNYDYEFDFKNLSCPTPLIKLKKELQNLPSNSVVKVLVTDSYFILDCKAWCMEHQHKFLEEEYHDGVISCYIRLDGKTDKSTIKEDIAKPSPTNIKPEDNCNIDITVEIDACGLQCPGPLLETKKVMDKLEHGEVAKITSTDFGYPLDIEKWCVQTGNTLIRTHSEKSSCFAIIKKGLHGVTNKIGCNEQTPPKQKTATIVCFSGDLDKVYAQLIIANGAAAMGQKVSLFFTFWGLNVLRKPKKVRKLKKTFMEKNFAKMMPRGVDKLTLSQMHMAGMGSKMMKKIMKKKNVATLQQLMKDAQDAGIEFIACTMSMDVMGLKREELIDGITYAGVGAYIGNSSDANITLFV